MNRNPQPLGMVHHVNVRGEQPAVNLFGLRMPERENAGDVIGFIGSEQFHRQLLQLREARLHERPGGGVDGLDADGRGCRPGAARMA